MGAALSGGARSVRRALLLFALLSVATGLGTPAEAAPPAVADPPPIPELKIRHPRGAPNQWAKLRQAYLLDLRERLNRFLPEATDHSQLYLLQVLAPYHAPEVLEIQQSLLRYFLAQHPEAPEHSGAQMTIDLLSALTVLQRYSRPGVRQLGDQAFARLLALAAGETDAGWIDLFVWEGSAWVEAAPTPAGVQALLPLVGRASRGETRAEALLRLARASASLGRREEAIAECQQVLALPKPMGWDMPERTDQRAYLIWAQLDPAILPQAMEHLNKYEQAWGGPATLTAPVVAAAAETVAKTDLPRAMVMVREAPQTQWILGGVDDTRVAAMLSLTETIAGLHPGRAEQILAEAMGIRGYTDELQVLEVLARLPPAVGQKLFYRYYPRYAHPERFAASDFGSEGYRYYLLLGALDPGLPRKLVARWQAVLDKTKGKARTDLLSDNPILSGVASRGGGQVQLQGWGDSGAAERLAMWIEILWAWEAGARVSSPVAASR